MSSYTKATNFATKDTLPTGDSNKIVKGTEIDNEFNAISGAISSKADLASPTFTGTPAGPTATAGASTTQLATTAFVTAALSAVYPVGSIYINAGVSTNPNTLLGFGTWTAFGAGKVLVGLDSADALFDTLEEAGGSKDAIVVSHTHTATSTVTDPGTSTGYTVTRIGIGAFMYLEYKGFGRECKGNYLFDLNFQMILLQVIKYHFLKVYNFEYSFYILVVYNFLLVSFILKM
jgi:hypothetical protein